MDEPLCDTALTGNKLQDLLLFSDSSPRKIELKNGHRISGVEAKVIGEGSGFTSKVLRVLLRWGNEEDEEENRRNTQPELPRSCIVKVIGSSAMKKVMRELTEQITGGIEASLRQAHDIECKIYDLQEAGGGGVLSDTVPMVRCYAKSLSLGAEKPGLIVLEDLSDRIQPTSFVNMGLPLPRGQLEDILRALSSLHAWSVNESAGADRWRNTIPKLTRDHVIPNFYAALSTMFPAAKAAYPDQFEKLDQDKVNEHFSADKIVQLFGCDPTVRYNLPTVLVHGDIHMMNMLFEKKENENESGKLLALIDWQLAHHGCAMEDLARVIIMCVPYETAEGRDEILARYVKMFNEKVENVTNRVTFSDCKKAMDEMFAFLAVVFSFNVGMMDSMPTDMFQGLINEEQRLEFKSRILEQNLKNLKDGIKMYGIF